MKKTLSIVLLALTCPVWSQVKKKEAAPVTLFSVQGKPVGAEEFIYLYKKNHIKADDYTEQKVNEYVNLFIQFKLKVTEAKAKGLDTTAAFLKEFNSYKEELKRPYTSEKSELDRLTREAYQRQSEEVKASHILINVRPDAEPRDTLAAYNKALQIRERILKGEDFEIVAKEVSEDPSAKMNGGSLGYFTALQMVYPFESGAYGLKPGEISNPIRTRFGFHIIKVIDRRPAQGEVEVSHILLRTGTPDDKRIKNKIFEIEDQLQGGRNWNELCKEYSDDVSTRDIGGKLKPFGIGVLAGIPEFESAAFSLKQPGEISDPFQSAYGWHIIRLDRKIPIPTFKDVEVALQRRVARDERTQISDRKMAEDRKKQFGFYEDKTAKNSLLLSADTSLKKAKWRFKGDESLRGQTVFQFGEKKYSGGMFISFAEKNQSENTQAPGAYLGTLYDQFVLAQLNAAEEEKLIRENVEFRTLLSEYKEGILLFTIMEEEVWNKASKDTLGQRKFHEQNPEKFKTGNRVSARVYTTTDKIFFEDILKKVNAGDSISAASAKKFKSISPQRNYERGENKAVDKVSWAIGVQTTELDGTYYLVVIDNLVPPGTKSLDEARAQVISDYQDVLEKKWVGELKQKYPVKVNNKGKKFVVSELTKK